MNTMRAGMGMGERIHTVNLHTGGHGDECTLASELQVPMTWLPACLASWTAN